MRISHTARAIKPLLACLVLIAFLAGSCGKKNIITGPSAPAPDVFTGTPTVTNTAYNPAATFSFTLTATATQTYLTASATATNTVTPSFSPSLTLTGTAFESTPTNTQTASATETITITLSPEYTPTFTATQSLTRTFTPSFTESITATVTHTTAFSATITPTFGGNRGSLEMSPSSFISGTSGTTVTFTYTAGELGWIGPDPLYGTLKITMPADWSPPSLTLTDPGYFSVSLPNGGTLVGLGVNGRDIVVRAADIQALTGKIVVVYGDKSFGGPGALIGAPGTFTIASEAGEAGDTTHPVNSNPMAVVIPPTATVTPTFTPVIGEGTVTVLPVNVTDGSAGNTIMFTYTAGKTSWTAAPEGGTIKITIPAGWSQPSVEDTYPGCFYAFASGGAEVVSLLQQGASMIVRVKNLPAFTGTITIVYGYKGKGGPGAVINGAGTFTMICETDPLGENVYPIASSPLINVIAPTGTITMTATQTGTQTITPSITETFTITQTHTNTGTETITQTVTTTSTVTQTVTATVTSTGTATPTVTSTITPSWELIGTRGFSSGRAYYTAIDVYQGVPYAAYSDGSYNNRVFVKKYESGSWQGIGTGAVSEGLAEDVKISVYGGIPYVAYRDNLNGNIIKVKRFVNSSWETLDINGTAASAGAAYDMSFTIDGNGTPWVAFRDGINSGRLSVRKYDLMNGWEDMGTAITSGIASDISIKVYNGEAFVAFRDWDMAYRARVLKRDAIWGTWAQYGASPLTLADANSVSLYIENDGTMFAAFTETNNYNRVSVMKYLSGGWSYYGGLPVFSSENCSYVSLSSFLGAPYVAYRDGGRGNSLTVARNKASWEIVGYNISPAQAEYISLVFDNQGQMPYVIFADESAGYKATVMRYTGNY